MVGRAVRSATSAAVLFGEDLALALPTIERLAREDLTALAEAVRPALRA
jgi:hypothetical protein